MTLHHISSPYEYLQRMGLSALEGGIWANFTILFWLAQFAKSTIEAWSTRINRPYIIVGEEFAKMNENFILVYHEGMYGHFEPIIDILHSNLPSIHPLWKHDHENNKSSLHEDIKTCSNVLKKRKIQHDAQMSNIFEFLKKWHHLDFDGHLKRIKTHNKSSMII